MYPITSGRFSSFGRIVFYTTKLLKCTSPQELQFNGSNPFTFQYKIWCGDSWALFSINLPASWASFSQSDEKCWKCYLNWKKKWKNGTHISKKIFFLPFCFKTRGFWMDLNFFSRTDFRGRISISFTRISSERLIAFQVLMTSSSACLQTHFTSQQYWLYYKRKLLLGAGKLVQRRSKFWLGKS